MRLSALPFLILCATAPAATAQQAPLTPLSGTAAELGEPMTLITGVHPLPDGRVVVVDARERAIRIADFARNTVTQIGREGQGPNEYRTPRTTLSWHGDTVLVYDGGNRRLLKVAPDGALRGEITIPGAIFADKGVTPMAYADASGAIYLQITPHDFLRDERVLRRGVLARWMPGTERLDSIAPLMEREPGRPARGAVYFTRQDAWGVTREGRVAIARALDYRVEWREPSGAIVAGPRVEYTPVPVTDDEREAFERLMASLPPAGATMSGGSSQSTSTEPRRSAPRTSDGAWPETKPPFEERDRLGRPGTVMSASGEFWVTRNRAWNDSIPTVDVFDGRGRLARRVRLPAHTRVVRVDDEAVYLVRKDADDLEWLIRVRIAR